MAFSGSSCCRLRDADRRYKMKKYTLKIEGMACNMCEAHVNEAVRKAVPQAKKVTSSFKKGETVFLADGEIDQAALSSTINATGYQCLRITSEIYEKKGLFGLW